MKKQLKSLLAIAVAVSLGLGFTSCKKDDPEPKPEPTPTEGNYILNNAIAFNTGLLDVCDITLEFTGLDGKAVTKNVKDLPTKETTLGDKKYTMYVFEQKETTKTIPAETKVNITYTLKSDLPAEGKFDCYVAPDFYCGQRNAADTGWTSFADSNTAMSFGGIDVDKASRIIESLTKTYSSFVLNIDKDGKPSVK